MISKKNQHFPLVLGISGCLTRERTNQPQGHAAQSYQLMFIMYLPWCNGVPCIYHDVMGYPLTLPRHPRKLPLQHLCAWSETKKSDLLVLICGTDIHWFSLAGLEDSDPALSQDQTQDWHWGMSLSYYLFIEGPINHTGSDWEPLGHYASHG